MAAGSSEQYGVTNLKRRRVELSKLLRAKKNQASCFNCRLPSAYRLLSSNNPRRGRALLRGALVGLALAVAAGAVGGDGVDGSALALAGDGEDGRDVRRERLLERGERRQRGAVRLRLRERVAVYEVRLDVGARQLHGARHQGLDRVGHVVRLVEHVGRRELLDLRQLGVHQLVEDEEELEGLDRARVEVVVAVLRVVEVEAGELAELDEARDDHLDVDVRRVVAEVYEAERLRPQLERAVVARAPVVDDRRVEGRLVELVLDEEPPVRRQGGVDVAHALKVQLKHAAEVLLAGEVPAVADPDRVRLRPDFLTELDALDVVRNDVA